MCKTVTLNEKHYFVMKGPKKRELEQKASNHSSGTDFKDFMKLYKYYTKELNSLLANNTRKSITI